MGALQFFRRSNGLLGRKTYPVGCIQSRAFSDSKIIIDSNDTVLPVLIVGAGPVGLVLSILLTKLGIKCSVLEKFSKHPQAHFINNRSMEVFRKLDGLAEEIERSQPPAELWRKFIYCRSLMGSILGSVDQMQPQDYRKMHMNFIRFYENPKNLYLHTYETEHMWIAISNTALSVQNFKAAMAVPSALRLDPTVANSGRAQLSESLLNESNPLGSSVFTACKTKAYIRRREEPLTPVSHRGSWFQEIISTLDLVSGDKMKFLLIKAPL
ncbi:hypothetical protein EZV62_017410 [Acer yangbiense]|uniref:FAD-binding domain-containing protein n=1 Tax=Acer yangbiense TaxID=1000413 RepID=A0A5C7HGG9_9ROSI|nr:hypothetical protein EZV62_017410 [Acer yangbiense]